MIPRRLFWIVDFSLVSLAFVVAHWIWPEAHRALAVVGADWLPELLRPESGPGVLPRLNEMLWVVAIAGFATLAAVGVGGGYARLIDQSRTRIVVCSLVAPMCGAGVVALVLFLAKQHEWSRLFVVTFTGVAGLLLLAVRVLLRDYFRGRRAAGFYQRKVLVVGPDPLIARIEEHFLDCVDSTEYAICGHLSIPGGEDPPRDAAAERPLGQVDDLGDILISRHVDEVIAVQPSGDAVWVGNVIETCDALGILLRIVPEALLTRKPQVLRAICPGRALYLPSVVLAPKHFDSDALFFKRLIDVVVSGVALVVLSPLFALIALAIKISDPRLPILYRWNVVGRNGVRFTGYKFTTMTVDADDRRTELLAQNEMTGPVFKIKEDPRVTPLGRFLRKFSLNELPQLWSVLKGDMSLVGPRPAFPHELEGYDFWQKRKLSVRPGITCLWQVNGRNAISNFDDWVRMDLQYIDNWTLWLDIKILIRTVWVVVAGTGS